MVKIVNAYTLSECLDAMGETVEKYEAMGQRNIVFCEDRLTLVAERALMRRLGGSFLTEVTTFSRFLQTDRKQLSRQGSVMKVGEIMLALQAEGLLKCFTSADSVAANAKCIYEQLAQFSASELTSGQLKENVENISDEDGALKNKMRDLALVYERYDEFLQTSGYLDEGKYLSLLPACIKATKGIERTNIFFLCYSSFTAQAMKTVSAAIDAAANVVGVFFAGEEEIYTNQAYARFAECANQKGKAYALNKGEPLDGEAEVLRRGFFSMSEVALAGSEGRYRTDKVHIFAAPDKTGEAEFVAVNIKKLLMQDPEMRYRDFAVLTPSVEEYSLALKKAFREYSIPYSIDERISLKRHPLSKFILAVIETKQEKYTPAAVDRVLKNVFFGESDGYRNYLLKYSNYRGGAKRDLKFTKEKRKAGDEDVLPFFGGEEYLSGCRERLIGAVELFKTKATGVAYCEAVKALLTSFRAKETLDKLIESAEDEGTRSYLSQIEKNIRKVLDELCQIAGGKVLSLAEFAAVLEGGLEATEIAPNPLRLDAVFVGDLTDSRIERVEVLFALGMTDAVPRRSDDANLVTDRDKEKLKEIKTVLEPMVEEVNGRSRESACLNLCTFTRGLYLTYPLGSNGENPALSDIFYYIKELFATKEGFPLTEEKNYSAADFAYRCGAVAPAARQLLCELNEYETQKIDERREFASLYAALSRRGELPKCFGVLDEGVKTIENAEELFFQRGVLSPSTLEGYFACPYKNFAERGLKLKEREETAVLATDTGNFIHALLERVTEKVREFDTEEAFANFANEVGRGLMNDGSAASQTDTAAGKYSQEKLLKEGVTVARAVYRQVQDSGFTEQRTEQTVSTADFYGKVDRVDESDKFVRVIDYKTGRIDATPVAYYTGQKLQMELYMSAVRGEKTPAGVLYFPASEDFRDSEDGRFRMQGFLNGDSEALLCGDRNLTDENKSEYFEAKLTDNARLEKVMDGETFMQFLDYGIYLSRGAIKEIREGFIAPSPYKGSCDYCKFGGMCGFHKEVHAVRSEERITPKKIAAIAKAHKEGEDNE
ncbi:MAG: exodeoxyribonuclease V subunit gamma [Clostridia bacterium]|nr:exodeoxyribonuclease V subunit gamma [Clostridia bacterium]